MHITQVFREFRDGEYYEICHSLIIASGKSCCAYSDYEELLEKISNVTILDSGPEYEHSFCNDCYQNEVKVITKSGEGKVDPRVGIISSIFAVFGSIVGAYIMARISGYMLQRIIGVTMILVLILSFFKQIGLVRQYEDVPTMLRQVIGYVLFFIIGILSGSVGGQGLRKYVL